ncbi:ELKS/Rab6-interacting/CAST family member 1, partial [Orussus abietinus]|uniref:ELKS/Rab6-interacting/CAST family member 1 n=1 Tax=Orussus abietinus TaxID=222816 RepID=UPI0006258EF7
KWSNNFSHDQSSQLRNALDEVQAWKRETETKDHRISELEREMSELENFLMDHSDTDGILELKAMVQHKNSRIEELEDTVAEFEDFLRHNPDMEQLHEMKCELKARARRIEELESYVEKGGGEKDFGMRRERILELEGMVTRLEEYVKEHNVDVLQQKLQDREDRLQKLQSRLEFLEKDATKTQKEDEGGKDRIRNSDQSEKRGISMDRHESCQDQSHQDPPEKRFRKEDKVLARMEREEEEAEAIRRKLLDREQKMKEMEHAMSEKDNRIQEYEQQIVEWQDKLTRLRKEMSCLEKELGEYEAEDIGVLKEEIRVRDERVLQLEDEIDSLERAFSERMDLEQIEELVAVVKDKENRERDLENELTDKSNRLEELGEALRESIVIASEGEKRLKQEEEMRRTALDRVSKLEQRMASLQTSFALKCPTCRPLLTELQRTERKLKRLAEERKTQLEDLHEMKREALEAAVSEKDAHLALLELSGIKTAAQANQVDKLKADRKRLLEKLKEEDERSIELSVDWISSNAESAPFLTKILEPVVDVDACDDEGVDDIQDQEESPTGPTTNGRAHDHGQAAVARSASMGTCSTSPEQ